MRARRLIGSASYGPDQLRAMFAAFDGAWEVIAADIGDDPAAIESTRVKLAKLILSLASDDNLEPERLKDTALRLLPTFRGP
jgi:hypothetical protein